jgi:hypothetical protein
MNIVIDPHKNGTLCNMRAEIRAEKRGESRGKAIAEARREQNRAEARAENRRTVPSAQEILSMLSTRPATR